MMVRLSELRPGQVGIVQRIEADDALRLRLMEMGLLRGERVRVLKYAPLGDPIELEVGLYHLSLRRREAETILVEMEP
ncbi:MAG: iron transporter FeoA [Candidatus Poribacteria bacterium]|nr:MAG: iron transporter FeoA [Candidatus Poribacteria bacterium]